MGKAMNDEYRREVVRRFGESGMTRKAFCQANDVAISTLDAWLRKYRKASGGETKRDMPMVSLGRAGLGHSGRHLRIITKAGIAVELDLPASEEEIAMILRAVSAV